MKVLIIDDSPRRYSKLVGEVKQIDGLSVKDIEVVSSIEDAEEKVDSLLYDLVVLDILIPYSNVDEEDKQNSIEFLEYLHSGCRNKPKRIIGISSDKQLLDEVSHIFSSKSWTVIEYSDVSDEWLHKILACINYALGNNDLENSNKNIDLLVVCALLSPELNAVLNLPWNWSEAILIDENIFIYFGSFEVQNKTINVAAAYTLRPGMVATAILCTRLLKILTPKIVTMTGICAGNKDEVTLGDVILAECTWDYQSGKLVKENKEIRFKISPHHLMIKDNVKNFFIQLSRDNDLFESLQSNIEGTIIVPSLKIGSLVSGASVIADDSTLFKIKDQQDRKVLGIEMEIYALYAACFSSAVEPLYFALKGVCDYGDSEKNDLYQKLAAKNSAQILQCFAEKYINVLL